MGEDGSQTRPGRMSRSVTLSERDLHDSELPMHEAGETWFAIHPTVAENPDADLLEFVPGLNAQLFRRDENERRLRRLTYAVNQQLANSAVDTGCGGVRLHLE